MLGDRLFVGTDADEFIFCAPNVEGNRDFLFGGDGADTFLLTDAAYSLVRTPDYICDFEAGRDAIDVSVIDAKARKGGDQAFDYINCHKFHDRAGELRFKHGRLTGDVDGDGHADFKIKFVGVDKLTADDFVL